MTNLYGIICCGLLGYVFGIASATIVPEPITHSVKDNNSAVSINDFCSAENLTKLLLGNDIEEKNMKTPSIRYNI